MYIARYAHHTCGRSATSVQVLLDQVPAESNVTQPGSSTQFIGCSEVCTWIRRRLVEGADTESVEGWDEGSRLGLDEGLELGFSLGATLGFEDGTLLGFEDGSLLGFEDGFRLGTADGMLLGSTGT